MTEQQRDAATRAAAQDLTGALKAVTAEVKRLRRIGRRNTAFIIIDVALTILLAAVGYVSVHAAQSAAHANSAQLALCQAGNVARAQQIQIWTHLIAVSATGKPQTAQQLKTAAEFAVYIRRSLAPRDCAALGKGS
jgi:hypothetical protein